MDHRRAAAGIRPDPAPILFDAAPILGVDNLKVGADDDGNPVAYDHLCAGFDALATDAAQVGVKIGYENVPWALIAGTEESIRFITDVANPNGGFIVDIWHAQRGGTPYSVIPELFPLEYMVGVELDDGYAEPAAKDLRHLRQPLICGDRRLRCPLVHPAVVEVGWTGPWGIEHMSSHLTAAAARPSPHRGPPRRTGLLRRRRRVATHRGDRGGAGSLAGRT